MIGSVRGAERMRSAFRLPVIQNALALYGAQFANYLVPLATVPYLARTLGPQVFGLVAVGQALGVYAMLVVEYGFAMSATRQVARSADARDRWSQLLGSVTTAKLLLSLTCLIVVGAVQAFAPIGRAYGDYLWVGAGWGIMAGLRPLWFFLGIEDVRVVTIIDVVAKSLAGAAVFMLVHGPSDGVVVLELQLCGAAVSTGIATWLAYRRAPFRLTGVAQARAALTSGFNVFLFRIAVSLYSASNVFLLGFVAPTATVGLYAGAEKIYRVLVGFIDPLSQAIYPEASRLVLENRERAVRRVRLNSLAAAGCGVLATVVMWVLAPTVVRLLLGSAFASSVPVLRALSLLFPVLMLSVSLAAQWVFPLALDSLMTRAAIIGGLIHVPMALVLGSRLGGLGVSLALIGTESVILSIILVLLTRAHINPFLASAKAGARRFSAVPEGGDGY